MTNCKRALALALALLLSACAGPSAASVAPSNANPAITCHGGIDRASCPEIAASALALVDHTHGTPAHVWVTDALFCSASPDCLFDPTANFPYPVPPTGGQWRGSAEIAFAGSLEHAGVLVAIVGGRYSATLLGYRIPRPGWCSGDCGASPTASSRWRWGVRPV